MVYGLDARAYIENGPALKADEVRRTRQSFRYRAWQKLDAQSRLKLIETAMRPANDDLIDSYPLAL